MSDQFESLKNELLIVLRKYKASIDGCGCCGSPYLQIGDETEDEVRLDGTTEVEVE